MANLTLILILWALASACPASDGSPSSPFYVDSTTTATSTTGSSCAPFISIEAALFDVSALSSVWVSLKSAATLPSWTVNNAVSLEGGSNILEITGVVFVPGWLKLSEIRLISSLNTDFVLKVTGKLTIDSCNISRFPSPLIYVRGLVNVTNSVFEGNLKGVFSTLELGGNLTVSSSQFLYNAVNEGSVFEVYPSSGADSTHYSISNCTFEGNGVPGGSSVLALNDVGAPFTTAAQTISFSNCSFQSQPVSLFQIASSLFDLSVSDCRLWNETQLITGILQGTKVTLEQLSASECKGPLLVLQVTGKVSLSHSNFTNIANGPIVTAKGTGHSSSFISLSHINVLNISNSDSSTYSNLINAQALSIELFSVHISNYTSLVNGVFFLVNVVLTAQRFSAMHGSASGNVIGLNMFSEVSMSDIYYENVSSGGSMWYFLQSSATIKRATFRKITGFWMAEASAYTTTMFMFVGESSSWIDNWDALLINSGIPKSFSMYCSLRITNSIFAGPMGMGLVAADHSYITMRNITITSSSGISFNRRSPGSYYDMDQMVLRDMELFANVWSVYECVVFILRLEMVNVTAPAFVKGKNYTMILGEAVIDRSKIGWLVDSGIAV